MVVRNFGPPMRNVRVLASARSQVTVEPAIINVSDVIAELPTNAERRIPWQINRTQLGNRRADAVLGLKLAYELHHANASVPQRCSDNLTYYIFDESPDPVTRISVEPATQSVHQGVDAEFRISVRRLDDQVAPGVNVTVEDNLAGQSHSLEMDDKGKADYRSATNGIRPGRHELVFDSETAEQPVHARVVVLPEAVTVEVAPESQAIEPGDAAAFDVIVQKLDGSPAPFVEVAVEDPFSKETRSLSADAQGRIRYESQSKNDQLGTCDFTFSSPGADVPAKARVLVEKEPTLKIAVEPEEANDRCRPVRQA